MMRLRLCFSALCLIFWAGSSAAAQPAQAKGPVATVIALDGQAEWLDGDAWKPVALGQCFGPGDHLRCGKDGSLQCVVNGAVGLALDVNSLLMLPTQDPGTLMLNLNHGRLGCFADASQTVEVHSGNAMVQAGPGPIDLEMGTESQNTIVNTGQAGARFGDPAHINTLDLAPYSSGILVMDRVLGPNSMGKRDISDMNARWERARTFFGQRKELLKAMAAMPEHAGFVKALKKRQTDHDQSQNKNTAGE